MINVILKRDDKDIIFMEIHIFQFVFLEYGVVKYKYFTIFYTKYKEDLNT